MARKDWPKWFDADVFCEVMGFWWKTIAELKPHIGRRNFSFDEAKEKELYEQIMTSGAKHLIKPTVKHAWQADISTGLVHTCNSTFFFNQVTFYTPKICCQHASLYCRLFWSCAQSLLILNTIRVLKNVFPLKFNFNFT